MSKSKDQQRVTLRLESEISKEIEEIRFSRRFSNRTQALKAILLAGIAAFKAGTAGEAVKPQKKGAPDVG